MQIGVSASSSLTNVLSAVSGTPLLLGEGTALHQLDTEKATAGEPWVKCDGAILCSAISLDGLVLATCQRLVLHTHYNRSDSLTPLTTFKVHHIPKSVAVARVATDIYAVAVGGADGALLRYICLNDNQTDTADWVSQVHPAYPMCCLAFSPSAKLLAMGCSDGRLALWDVADLCATQQLVEVGAGLAPEPLSSASPIWHAAIPSETQRPCSVAVHQEDLLLAVGCWDGACCLYHKTAEGQWNATCQLLLPEDRMMLFDHTQPGAWVQWRPSSSSQLLVASSVPPQVELYQLCGEGKVASVLARWRPEILSPEHLPSAAIKGLVATPSRVHLYHRDKHLTTLLWPCTASSGQTISHTLRFGCNEGDHLIATPSGGSLELTVERSDGADPSIAMPFVEAALLGKLQGWVSSGGLTVWLDSVVWWHTQHVGWAACIVKGDSVHLAAMDNTGSEMVLVDSAGRMCRMNTGEPLGAPREWQQLVEVSGTMHWLVSVAADCGSLLVVRQQEANQEGSPQCVAQWDDDDALSEFCLTICGQTSKLDDLVTDGCSRSDGKLWLRHPLTGLRWCVQLHGGTVEQVLVEENHDAE